MFLLFLEKKKRRLYEWKFLERSQRRRNRCRVMTSNIKLLFQELQQTKAILPGEHCGPTEPSTSCAGGLYALVPLPEIRDRIFTEVSELR